MDKLETMQAQQQQELFESIRHFNKYKSYSAFNSALAIPAEADNIQDDLIRLYEEQYESSGDE